MTETTTNEGLVEWLARGIDTALRHLDAGLTEHAVITLRGLLEHVEVPQERYVTADYMNDLIRIRVAQAVKAEKASQSAS